MQRQRRYLTLALATLPWGCAIQALKPLPTEPAPTPTNPPPRRPAAVGQRWSYQRYNTYNSELIATEEYEVSAVHAQVSIRQRSKANAVDGIERQTLDGRMLRELAWDKAESFDPALPLWPSELKPGARSSYRGHYRVDGFSYRYWLTQDTTVHGWEYVTLALGRMLALRVEHYIRQEHHDLSREATTRHDRLWLAPETGRWLAREVWGEYLVIDSAGQYRGLENHHRWELVSWS